jgi:phospholipid/cholesterol/gamma-HCH transport system substrate-binding protein
MRSFRNGGSPFRAGIVALVLIAIGTYFAFAKDFPFTRGYQIKAVFENSNLVQPRSPVRIAGVDVGKVVKVERYKDTKLSLVTMEITDAGRPVHDDATAKVRPRLFLEGNFYVDLEPGTPAGRELEDGDTLPAAQTANPVQLDQLLTALQSDTRESLQKTFKGLGTALSSKPTPEDDADQDPSVHGKTGAEALNLSLEHSEEALRGSAIVNDALQGEAPRDLSRIIRGAARLAEGLAEDEVALGSLISNLNTTLATMASRAPELERTVQLLGPTAANARRGFASMGRALPPTRAFAREILPGVRETPATIAAASPWLDQAYALLGQRELGGLLDELEPATGDLAGLTHESVSFLRQVHLFNRCANEVLIPTGRIEVDDGPHSAGVENYKEFWYSMVGAAGEGQSFDGNGSWLRLASPGGAQTITSGQTTYDHEPTFGRVTTPPLETRPAFPGELPPLRRDVPCHRNPVPDVNGPASRGPADGSRPNAAPLDDPPISAVPVASAAQLQPVSTLGSEDGE